MVLSRFRHSYLRRRSFLCQRSFVHRSGGGRSRSGRGSGGHIPDGTEGQQEKEPADRSYFPVNAGPHHGCGGRESEENPPTEQVVVPPDGLRQCGPGRRCGPDGCSPRASAGSAARAQLCTAVGLCSAVGRRRRSGALSRFGRVLSRCSRPLSSHTGNSALPGHRFGRWNARPVVVPLSVFTVCPVAPHSQYRLALMIQTDFSLCDAPRIAVFRFRRVTAVPRPSRPCRSLDANIWAN